jgi:hypothetical protein
MTVLSFWRSAFDVSRTFWAPSANALWTKADKGKRIRGQRRLWLLCIPDLLYLLIRPPLSGLALAKITDPCCGRRRIGRMFPLEFARPRGRIMVVGVILLGFSAADGLFRGRPKGGFLERLGIRKTATAAGRTGRRTGGILPLPPPDDSQLPRERASPAGGREFPARLAGGPERRHVAGRSPLGGDRCRVILLHPSRSRSLPNSSAISGNWQRNIAASSRTCSRSSIS